MPTRSRLAQTGCACEAAPFPHCPGPLLATKRSSQPPLSTLQCRPASTPRPRGPLRSWSHCTTSGPSIPAPRSWRLWHRAAPTAAAAWDLWCRPWARSSRLTACAPPSPSPACRPRCRPTTHLPTRVRVGGRHKGGSLLALRALPAPFSGGGRREPAAAPLLLLRCRRGAGQPGAHRGPRIGAPAQRLPPVPVQIAHSRQCLLLGL